MDSTPKAPSELSQDLLDGWNLADDSGPGVSDDDSLLAPARGPKLAPGPLFGSGPPWGTAGRSDPDAVLFRAFSLSDEADAAQDADFDLSGHPHPPFAEPPPPPGAEAVARAPVNFPRPGQAVGGFQIVGELGRGAFARVYLAEQASLGRRLVALKVSRAEGEEPQILARLQHTHIVPIYSVHDEPETGLRLICMPYLGGANLAQVLEAAGARLPAQATGRSLVEALDVASNRLQADTKLPLPSGLPPSLRRRSAIALPPSQAGPLGSTAPESALASDPTRSSWSSLSGWRRAKPDPSTLLNEAEFDQPARQFLRGANSIQASVWIVARLAEGLDHAHSRGLLHRDLKPSNILIAADGMPMLLDFNLSAERQDGGPSGGAKALLGGTLPYMAPEHLDAFDPDGRTTADAVDERSDLYSLGLILFEMIAGEHPFPEPPPALQLVETIRFMLQCRRVAPSLREAAPEVPWSLDALVAKCLDPDPDRRYRRARDLAEDLRRFLDDLPMKHAPEPSPRERMAKWARRNPRLCSTTSIALVSTVLLLVLGGFMGLLSHSLQNISARFKYHWFHSKQYDDCRFLLNTGTGPESHLGAGVAAVEYTLRELGFDARGDWPKKAWVSFLTPAEQAELRQQVRDLVLLEARARVYRAKRLGSEADRRSALEWAVRRLDLAEGLDGRPPAALFGDRARYLAALGRADEAARDRAREERTPLTTSRDFALRGTALLANGDLAGAEATLARARSLQKDSFWTIFALGLCHFQQGRYLEAAGDFGTCTAIKPDFAWPELNWGLALANAGRLDDALRCYDRAIALSPNFAEAFANRALVHLERNDAAGAERDLRRAIELGRADANVLAALGQALAHLGRRDEGERLYAELLGRQPDNTMVLVARGFFRLATDPDRARADLARALELEPRNPRAHYGLARLLFDAEPASALDHAETALEADPGFLDARGLRASLRARQGDAAAVDDVNRLVQSPTPYRLYNAACALAVLSDRRPELKLSTRALEVLRQAVDAGFPRAEIAGDPVWRPYHKLPAFQRLSRTATASAPPKS